MSVVARWKQWARLLKRETLVLYFAIRDARTPWYAKGAALCVVAYALSPIDLIPDPIPVLGYLDDLIIVPLGILLVRRLIPPVVLADSRTLVDEGATYGGRIGLVGAVVIISLWMLTLAAIGWAVFSRAYAD